VRFKRMVDFERCLISISQDSFGNFISSVFLEQKESERTILKRGVVGARDGCWDGLYVGLKVGREVVGYREGRVVVGYRDGRLLGVPLGVLVGRKEGL